MEKIKSVNFVNDCYGERTMDIIRNDEGSIEFHEMYNDDENEKTPSKIVNWATIKWCAENGKIDTKDVNEYVGETVSDNTGEHEIIKVKKISKKDAITPRFKGRPKKVKKAVKDSYEGLTVKYNGRSKKIKSELVSVESDTGIKCKIKDEDGNEATVSKTTLKKI